MFGKNGSHGHLYRVVYKTIFGPFKPKSKGGGPVGAGPRGKVLVLRQLNPDIPVRHSAVVVALQEERPGLAFVAVERAAGDPRNFQLVVDRYAVAHHRHSAAHQRDVERLPLAGARAASRPSAPQKP